jgi:hypothetical protein
MELEDEDRRELLSSWWADRCRLRTKLGIEPTPGRFPTAGKLPINPSRRPPCSNCCSIRRRAMKYAVTVHQKDHELAPTFTVFVEGTYENLGAHESMSDAHAAIRRYEAADKPRKPRKANR